MNSMMTEQKVFSENRNQIRDTKEYKNFYNFDEETPMKFRIYLFRQ